MYLEFATKNCLMNETEEFVRYLNSTHARTRAVVTLIPPDKVNWTFQPGKFTAGDLVRHLALTKRNMFIRVALGEQITYKGCGSEHGETYDQILTLFDRLQEESLDIIRGFGAADFDKKCISPSGAPITVRKWLRAMIEHEIHHRGQLYIYLSMMGVRTPPVFGMTSEELIQKAAAAQKPPL